MGARPDDQREREELQAHPQRRRALHVLQVQRVQEERADQDPGGAEHDQHPGDQRPGPPQPRRHQRPAHRPLDRGEPSQQDQRQRQQQGPGRPPAMRGRARQRVGERHQTRHGQRRAGQVELAAYTAPRLVPGHQMHAQQAGHHPDGHVHQEHRPPAEPGRQHPAGQHPDGRAGPAERAPHAQRGRPLRTRVAGRDDGQRRGRQQRGAEPLPGPGGDQRACCRRQAAGQRRGREHRQAGEEDPAPARHVRGPAAEQHQAAAGQHVGGDDPLQATGGQAERPCDRRQRHVHHGGIEDHHELGHAEQNHHRPRAALAGRRATRRRIPVPAGHGDSPRAKHLAHSVHPVLPCAPAMVNSRVNHQTAAGQHGCQLCKPVAPLAPGAPLMPLRLPEFGHRTMAPARGSTGDGQDRSARRTHHGLTKPARSLTPASGTTRSRPRHCGPSPRPSARSDPARASQPDDHAEPAGPARRAECQDLDGQGLGRPTAGAPQNGGSRSCRGRGP